MGRTNYVLLALGLASAVMLSMFMQHLLSVQKTTKQSPLPKEIVAVYGSRLFGDPTLAVEPVAGGKQATLTLRSLAGVDKRRLARDTGEFVWLKLGAAEQLTRVEVRCLDELDGKVEAFPIDKPAAPR